MPKAAPDAVHRRWVPKLEPYSYMHYGSRTFALCTPGVLAHLGLQWAANGSGGKRASAVQRGL